MGERIIRVIAEVCTGAEGPFGNVTNAPQCLDGITCWKMMKNICKIISQPYKLRPGTN